MTHLTSSLWAFPFMASTDLQSPDFPPTFPPFHVLATSFFTRPLSILSLQPLPRLDYPFQWLSIETLVTPTSLSQTRPLNSKLLFPNIWFPISLSLLCTPLVLKNLGDLGAYLPNLTLLFPWAPATLAFFPFKQDQGWSCLSASAQVFCTA